MQSPSIYKDQEPEEIGEKLINKKPSYFRASKSTDTNNLKKDESW
jgi:hypothetical protein